MTVDTDTIRRRCHELVDRLVDDELNVAELILSRIDDGRAEYGPMRLAEDGRDLLEEALEEDVDGMIYRSMFLVRGRRL